MTFDEWWEGFKLEPNDLCQIQNTIKGACKLAWDAALTNNISDNKYPHDLFCDDCQQRANECVCPDFISQYK